MDLTRKRNLFLAITVVLVVAIVAVSAVILVRGPRESSVELVSNNGDGTATVNDINDGNMTIPYYDINVNTYKLQDFKAGSNGTIVYEGGDSFVGINVNSQMGAIDWAQVKQSGVDFALIRVGWRGKTNGNIVLDSNFQANIEGALAAEIHIYVDNKEVQCDVSPYLEKGRTYIPMRFAAEPLGAKVTWDNSTKTATFTKEDTVGEQVTSFIKAFCDKIELAGFTASYYADKTMAYETLQLDQLTSYDLWYAEYRAQPGFYYDFGMWQYTDEGTVSGISGSVPITLSFKNYPSLR